MVSKKFCLVGIDVDFETCIHVVEHPSFLSPFVPIPSGGVAMRLGSLMCTQMGRRAWAGHCMRRCRKAFQSRQQPEARKNVRAAGNELVCATCAAHRKWLQACVTPVAGLTAGTHIHAAFSMGATASLRPTRHWETTSHTCTK